MLGMSLSPCCRFHPAEALEPHRSDFGSPCCLRPPVGGSAFGANHFRGHFCVHCCYGPVTRRLPTGDVVDRLQSLGFPPPCYPNYGVLIFAPAGLSPAEHASLRWTHNRTGRFPASGSRTRLGFPISMSFATFCACLVMERVQHVNRIKGLLFSQGASGYEPLRRDRRARPLLNCPATARPWLATTFGFFARYGPARGGVALRRASPSCSKRKAPRGNCIYRAGPNKRLARGREWRSSQRDVCHNHAASDAAGV